MNREECAESEKLDVECHAGFRSNISIDYSHCGLHIQTEHQANSVCSCEERQRRDSIIADACCLPFRDESFRVAFSYHGIEHAQDPLSVLREMCRVAKRKAVLRYFCGKRSVHNLTGKSESLDEEWFNKASDILGLENTQFVIAYKNPVISKLQLMFPRKMQTKLLRRGLRRWERTKFMRRFQVSSEIEAWFIKQRRFAGADDVRFIVVYNIPEKFRTCFAASPYVKLERVNACRNLDGEPLPKFFNQAIREHMQENVWFVFCHQDFVLEEDLLTRLKGKDTGALYGPIGGRLASDTLTGLIVQRDGTTIGSRLEEDAPVQTLDEMCLIVHAAVLRQGLLFDEAFRFHFYGADFCMEAYVSGFDVLAIPLGCQHKSRTIHGDVASPQYWSSLSVFREKWKRFLPIRTTTKLVTCETGENDSSQT